EFGLFRPKIFQKSLICTKEYFLEIPFPPANSKSIFGSSSLKILGTTRIFLLWFIKNKEKRFVVSTVSYRVECGCRVGRSARLSLRPLSALTDFFVARKHKRPFHQSEQSPEEDFSCETLLEHLPRFAVTKSLCPDYDESSLRWLLQQASEKQWHGKLRKALV